MIHVTLVDVTKTYIYVPVNRNSIDDAKEWCKEVDSPGTFSMGGFGLYFARPEDAVLCKLRWS